MGKKAFIMSLFLVTGFFIASAQTTVVDSILSNGIMRSYRLYVPAIYDGSSARPLILNLHGAGSTAGAQQLYGNFMPIADTANILVVQPQGTSIAGQTYWNANFSPFGANDIQFLSDLIDSLRVDYNIDLEAVYSTGMSNGGYMSHTLACALSHRIAAIASVAGSMVITQYPICTPNRAVPVMQIHGTADSIVPYAGNSTSIAVDTLIKYWVKNNNCNPVPTFSNVPDINTSDGCTAEHYVYSGGTQNADVELYKIIGGEHSWPDAIVNIGVTNRDFNATNEIWRFFRKYRLNLVTGINEKEQAIAITIYPNPADDQVLIRLPAPMKVTLSDLSGRVLRTVTTTYENTLLDVSGLAQGTYLLTAEGEQGRGTRRFIKN